MHRSRLSRSQCLRTLGLKDSASIDEVKQAYRRLAQESHPDKHGGSEEANKRFAEISVAFETLRRLDWPSPDGDGDVRRVPPHEIPLSRSASQDENRFLWKMALWQAALLLWCLLASVFIIPLVCFFTYEAKLPKNIAKMSPEGQRSAHWDARGIAIGVGVWLAIVAMAGGYAILNFLDPRRLARRARQRARDRAHEDA